MPLVYAACASAPGSATMTTLQSPQTSGAVGFAQAFSPHPEQVYFVLLAALVRLPIGTDCQLIRKPFAASLA